ncbi:hypothetical protein F5I97DRAFT_1421280 [Phlebopus sp. FC_14]|nr:hypothetical protein F5I97DRAFT_1421280 [Phlebopus sp. FC_14]
MAGHRLLDDQADLAEQLQLLNQLRYSDEPMRCEGKKYYHGSGDANAALRVLDTIALVLTTGKPGEVFAAAFDRSQSVTLVLAKNDSATQEDVQAVHELITTITASTTESAYDVLPFLFSRCRENIERRIRKLIAAVDILLGSLDEILESYTPSHPPDKEFPNSEDYRRYKYPNGEPPFKEMVCRLFKDLRAAGVGVDLDDIHMVGGELKSSLTGASSNRIDPTMLYAIWEKALCMHDQVVNALVVVENLEETTSQLFHLGLPSKIPVVFAERT